MKKYTHILVATDGSKLSLRAAKEGAELARELKAKITAVYVIAPWTPPLSSAEAMLVNYSDGEKAYREATVSRAEKALGQVAKAAASSKVKCDYLSVTNSQPWDGIIKAARTKKCDLIVMASHGHGALAGILLGSETHKVLSHSKIPVLVCR